MSDIEQKALKLVSQLQEEDGGKKYSHAYHFEALCRAIEQHEAFRQEVSDAVKHCHACSDPEVWRRIKFELDCFIIPKPKPDPLVAALEGVTFDHYPPNDAKTIRAALEARGLEIRSKNDD